MKLVHDTKVAIQQPRHKTPELIDYDDILPKPHKVKVEAAKYVSKHPRLVEKVHTNMLPAKADRVIIDHTEKALPSVSPFDMKFPVYKAPPKSHFVWSVSPWSNDFPIHFHKEPEPAHKVLLPSQEAKEGYVSMSPWDTAFPKSRLSARHNRKSRNRGQRRRRHLALAMWQYKKEHGPANQRTWSTVPEREDPNLKTYSPWQEEEFAKMCGLPLSRFMKTVKYREWVRLQSVKKAEQLAMHPPVHSVSPWDAKFPGMADLEKRASIAKMVTEYKRASLSGSVAVPAHPDAAAAIKFATPRTITLTGSATVAKPVAPSPPATARDAPKAVIAPAPLVAAPLTSRASLKQAIDIRAALNVATPNAALKGVKVAAAPVAPLPVVAKKVEIKPVVAEIKKAPVSPTAPLKAAAFPAISPKHRKSHKAARRSSNVEEETRMLAAPYVDRFLMGVL